ncbi:polysaccharide biosynthesis protein [Tomitella biformata]|uniref:polysaccharide biosynthesis protein n=1 Tax=Tomitella biformata TaxID=630403 RepID=UPI0004638FCE|nr:polysaccharide biosynthesis protein [Tomitella biformata]
MIPEPTSPPATAVSGRRFVTSGLALVTVGAMTANVLSYLLHLLAGRMLLPEGYGEFASLLTAQLVLAVPALALQTVIARSTARGGGESDARALTYRAAAVVAVLAAALTPLLSWLFTTSLTAAASALVAAPLLVLLAGEQGLLQGRERFGALGAILAAAGLGKVLPAVAALALGSGAAGALAAGAAGTAVVVLAARFVGSRRVAAGALSAGASGSSDVAAVLRASQVQLVLIALSSIDLLIARAVLTETDAGLYAMGAVATKAAFWLPQAVGVVLYPRMSRPEQSLKAVRTTLAVLLGVGAVVVIGAALAGPLLPMLVGEDYRPITGLLWLFALEGAVLALLQGALIGAIARERTALAAVAWVGLGIEAVVLSLTGSMLAMLVGATICVAVTTAAMAALVLRSVAAEPAR